MLLKLSRKTGKTRLTHVLSVDQFSLEQLHELCDKAEYFESRPVAELCYLKRGKVLANLFYEPSTRTSSSFYSAMARLGGSIIPINSVNYSSVAKGESLEDTIRTMACYADAIVLRHPEAGAAMRAAAVSTVPIINAGDGDNEHPTQALLDYYTIQKHIQHYRKHNRQCGEKLLHVVMMGDLLRGRTVKSLAKLLRKEPVRISWVSPSDLRIQSDFIALGEIETDDVTSVIHSAHVLYLTRTQTERGSSTKSVYGMTPEIMQLASPNLILMHPLPRLTELPTSLDADPRSVYFQQMRNGLFMRMAVLDAVL
jgi:aspartate carbamoyltransferase